MLLPLPSQYQVISLAGAAEKLLGPSMDTMTDKGMKTKVRRLYDIANVLTSLRLIDKVTLEPLTIKDTWNSGTSETVDSRSASSILCLTPSDSVCARLR